MGSMSESWEETVLRIVRAKNGAISLQEIYRAMEQHPLVTPHHREEWRGQPNYHHWIRSAMARLNHRGAVRRVGRGLYTSNP